jgi:hypothetical protein
MTSPNIAADETIRRPEFSTSHILQNIWLRATATASRMDFLLKGEQIVIETKMTRLGLGTGTKKKNPFDVSSAAAG